MVASLKAIPARLPSRLHPNPNTLLSILRPPHLHVPNTQPVPAASTTLTRIDIESPTVSRTSNCRAQNNTEVLNIGQTPLRKWIMPMRTYMVNSMKFIPVAEDHNLRFETY